MTACFEADGLYCDMEHAESTCVSMIPTGGDCTSAPAGCSTDDYCDATCLKKLARGEACFSFYNCADDRACAGQLCTDRPLASDVVCAGYVPAP